jgi:hypothetical protein
MVADDIIYKLGLVFLGFLSVILCLTFAFQERLEKIFTTVLAVATVALVVTAVIQHYDTIDAINQSKTMAEAMVRLSTNDRAWVFIKYDKLEINASDATQRFINLLVRFSLHNYGNTPAIVKSVEPHMFYIFVGNPAWHVEPDPRASSAVQWRETETPFLIEESPQPGRVIPDPSAAMSREYSADQVVIPTSGEINLTAPFRFENVVVGLPQMSPEDVARIWPRSGQNSLPGDSWFFCDVHYTDVYGVDRETGYYARLSMIGGRAEAPSEQNDKKHNVVH